MNFYNDSFCEVVLSSNTKKLMYLRFVLRRSGDHFDVYIPLIVMFKDYDKYLNYSDMIYLRM